MEREVIRYFATLWRAGDVSTGRSGNEAWGYILSMGSTEGECLFIFFYVDIKEYINIYLQETSMQCLMHVIIREDMYYT